MTSELLQMFKMSRTRLTNLLPALNDQDMYRKLHANANSIGFLLRHIAEVEQLFAKNVFGLDTKVSISTVGKTVRDTGKFTDLPAALELLEAAAVMLEKAIMSQGNSDWQDQITTAEFGTVTKAEALARIISHTAYHAGQVGVILKYGTA